MEGAVGKGRSWGREGEEVTVGTKGNQGRRHDCNDDFFLRPRSATASVPTVYCLPALSGMLCAQVSTSHFQLFLTVML